MSPFTKSRHLKLLPGILIGLLALGIIFWKLHSSSPEPSLSAHLGSSAANRRMSLPHPATKPREREILPPSAESPLVSPDLSQAASLPPQASGSYIPPAPSEAAIAFQAGREKLMGAHQQLMRLMQEAGPGEQQQIMEKWHEEHAAELAAQQQLAIQMGAESRPINIPVPSAANIPANATPELREFLTARHAVMKDQAEMLNQLQNATPDQRQQAMQKWHEQNATRLEAMQSAASQLSKSQAPSQLPNR